MFEKYLFGQSPSFLDKDSTRSPIALKCAFEVAVKDLNLHMALFKRSDGYHYKLVKIVSLLSSLKNY